MNPEKIEAIINMSEARAIRDIQRLKKRLATLSCFLARSTERSLPFFKVLRGAIEAKDKEKRKLIT